MMNNSVLIQNIETLRQEHEMKIGELEEKVGVSVGYFSRLSKTPDTFPAIDVLSKLSHIMGISIDVLIRIDLQGMGKNSRLLQAFIDKLKIDTVQGKLRWTVQPSVFALSKVAVPRDIPCPYNTYIAGNPVYAKYKDDQEVVIQPLMFEKPKGAEPPEQYQGYRISLRKSGSRENYKTVCYSDLVFESIRASIFELAQFISRDLQDIDIQDEAISAIEKYLNS